MLDRHPEYQYLELLKQVLDEGDKRIDRTGIGTLSVFGAMARFDVGACAPILTTKRVYWKTAIKEMLWFLTGETNIQALLKQNVRIWTDWPLARYRKETGDELSAGRLREADRRGRFVCRALGRSRPGLWQAMAPLARAGWPRTRPDRRRDRRVAQQPDQPAHPVPRLERRGNGPDGAAALPHGLSVPRRQRPAVVPFVPAQRRRAAGQSVQLGRRGRAAGDDRAAMRSRTGRIHLVRRRRPSLSEPSRTGAASAHTRAETVSPPCAEPARREHRRLPDRGFFGRRLRSASPIAADVAV